MDAGERLKFIQETKTKNQKFIADLAQNQQLAEMRQRELNQNYQMHKDSLALKNKELMQNLHTNYFNISSGAVKGVADNTKGDTTKENLYASIADNFSENNMGFLGKAFFKGLAIKERGERETKEAEEKRKVYEDYLNKYGDVIQYLSATNKYAQDLMARQQLKNQLEQEFEGLIDKVETGNYTENQKNKIYADFSKRAGKALGEDMGYEGTMNNGDIVITNGEGKVAFVRNPHYLDNLQKQNQALNIPNTTQIGWSRQQQNQQQIPQQQQSQQQQMPNQQQQQEEPDYYNMEFKPDTDYQLIGKNGSPVTLRTDGEGKFNKGHEKLSDNTLEKLGDAGHVAKYEEIPTELRTALIKNYMEAVQNIKPNANRITAIDELIATSQESFLQGLPEGVANALKWFIPEEKAKMEKMQGYNIDVVLEPLRDIMPGIWTNQDFLKMMQGAWSIDKTPKSVREIMEVVKKVSIAQMNMYRDAFEEGARFKKHLQNYEKNAKKFAPIFAKYDDQNDFQDQNNTQGQNDGQNQGVAPKSQINDDGSETFFVDLK